MKRRFQSVNLAANNVNGRNATNGSIIAQTGDLMQTVAIAMQKGGSGKTTTAVNLAAGLAKKRSRVLVVDCDPQANASTWLGVSTEGKGVFASLCEGAPLKNVIAASVVKGVDVAPASAWLVGAEKALAGEVGAETVLRRRLRD